MTTILHRPKFVNYALYSKYQWANVENVVFPEEISKKKKKKNSISLTLTYDWLADQSPTNKKPCLKILVN